MCGIVGFCKASNDNTNEDCIDILVDGLKKLEYRGYDSAGVAVFDGDKILTVKAKGRLSELEKKLALMQKPKVVCGIGHTRWATHGEPSDVNSHPHGDERISIVHNGIIENYLHIKEFLIGKGYTFETETDTETIVKLLDYYYKKDSDPLAAIKNTISRLSGSYALGIIFSDYKDRIYTLRKDSPLIVGISDIGNFICSDIPAILKYTNRYFLLEEGEIATVTGDTVTVVDVDLNPREKEILTATMDAQSAQKNGYPHFMLKEINDIPDSIRQTVSPRIKDGLPDFGIDTLTDERIRSFNRIHIVACGTAMHAGLIGKYAIERLARKAVNVEIASEFRYQDPILGSDDMVVIVSQSGETADTLAALRLAKQRGAFVLAVVNVLGSSIAREADAVIYTYAGLEIAVASTKAYTVQNCIMYLLAIRLALACKTADPDCLRSLTASLLNMGGIVSDIIATQSENCKYIASLLQTKRDLFYLGRGVDYYLALEGSLKLKEISYIHSESYAAGELKHGTISLIVEGMPVIAITTQSALTEKMISNIKEVKTRGAKVYMITKGAVDHADQIAEHVLNLDYDIDELLMSIPTSVVVQLIAYYTAVLKGCDVDKPRNLAKSVTVE